MTTGDVVYSLRFVHSSKCQYFVHALQGSVVPEESLAVLGHSLSEHMHSAATWMTGTPCFNIVKARLRSIFDSLHA